MKKQLTTLFAAVALVACGEKTASISSGGRIADEAAKAVFVVTRQPSLDRGDIDFEVRGYAQDALRYGGSTSCGDNSQGVISAQRLSSSNNAGYEHVAMSARNCIDELGNHLIDGVAEYIWDDSPPIGGTAVYIQLGTGERDSSDKEYFSYAYYDENEEDLFTESYWGRIDWDYMGDVTRQTFDIDFVERTNSVIGFSGRAQGEGYFPNTRSGFSRHNSIIDLNHGHNCFIPGRYQLSTTQDGNQVHDGETWVVNWPGGGQAQLAQNSGQGFDLTVNGQTTRYTWDSLLQRVMAACR